MADSYAELPYPGLPYARTHPDHLAWLARLHGLTPAGTEACTVLEIACGDGLNVVGMTAASPGVRVAGFDSDATAIARGQAVADALGLGDRVDLWVADLLEEDVVEPADYVICHGLYTWAPPRVADAALAAVAGAMGPDSVGFLSFNLMPGWLGRRLLGATLARRGRGTPGERVAAARELLDALEPLEEREDGYGAVLAAERRRLAKVADPLLVHDDLSAATTAAWHADVVDHADHHGLQVLCDAHPDALDPVSDQELADLVSGRAYREVALVPATAAAAAQVTDAGREAAERLAAPARFTLDPGERPYAFALARLQAQRSADVTTLRHTRLSIADDAGRAILVHCDGTRDRAALARDAALAIGLDAGALDDVIDAAVERLAENALFVSGR